MDKPYTKAQLTYHLQFTSATCTRRGKANINDKTSTNLKKVKKTKKLNVYINRLYITA
jgi:hypothetical protein